MNEKEANEIRARADNAWQRHTDSGNQNDLTPEQARAINFQAAWGASSSFPVTETGNRVTLKDAAQRLKETAYLREDHPERKAAVAAYNEVKDRGDSLDELAPEEGTRGDRVDRRDAGLSIDSRDDADDAACLVLDGIKYRRAWFGSDDEIRALHARSKGAR